MMYQQFFKPLWEWLFALLGLLFFLPLLFVLTLFLGFYYRGNPFFVQKRIGKHNRGFMILKLKTMRNPRQDELGHHGTMNRVTPFGAFLRNSSLDELPQLLNVLMGQMSIIGPRPLLEEYLPLYNSHQIRRHEVKPGITGLAQISGRNAISWQEKFALDVEYVDQLSFKLDLNIFFKSLLKPFDRTGIYNSQDAVLPFDGTN